MLTIFDFDGTLCDSLPRIVSSITSLLSDFGGEIASRDEIDARVREGRGLHDTLRALLPNGANLPQPELEYWAEQYRQRYDTVEGEGGQPFEGAIDAVRAAAEFGPVAVVSMKANDLLGQMIRLFGLADVVDAHFGDDDVRPLKPNAALFTEHIVPAMPPFDQGVMIGDTPKDLRFGHNCGLITIHAAYGYGDPAECAAAVPDHSVASPAEIRPLLLRLAE